MLAGLPYLYLDHISDSRSIKRYSESEDEVMPTTLAAEASNGLRPAAKVPTENFTKERS
jgi:hypothetical protein